LYKQTDTGHHLCRIEHSEDGYDFPVIAKATALEGLMASIRLLVTIDDDLFTVESFAKGYPVMSGTP
jgi:hypothetical protein